jgi:hypothetical protein
MLHCSDVAVAQLGKGKPALGPINLALVVSKLSKRPLRNLAIRGSERAFDFLAVRPDTGIINAVRCVSIKTLTNFLKHSDFAL